MHVVYSNGDVFNIDPVKLKIRCYREESGEYQCPFQAMSWAFDGFLITMDYYEGRQEIDLDDYRILPGVSVLNTTAELITKYYACCFEPYPSISYTITLQQK